MVPQVTSWVFHNVVGVTSLTILVVSKICCRRRTADLGIRCVLAVVVDGKLADCCTESSLTEETLRDRARLLRDLIHE